MNNNKRSFLGKASLYGAGLIGLVAIGKAISSSKTNTNNSSDIAAANAEKKSTSIKPKLITMSDIKNLERNPTEVTPIKMEDSEWDKYLDEDAYYVLRREGTERSGTSPLNAEKREGQYVCAGCGLALFESSTKYESGTGWPSFFDPIEGRLGTKTDFKIGYPRKEYHCARCKGHQGHVFRDGPKPTGLRYCNNGLALDFIPKEA